MVLGIVNRFVNTELDLERMIELWLWSEQKVYLTEADVDFVKGFARRYRGSPCTRRAYS